jgi:hypothetical protein
MNSKLFRIHKLLIICFYLLLAWTVVALSSSGSELSLSCHPACPSDNDCDRGQCREPVRTSEETRSFALLINPGALITIPAKTEGRLWPIAIAAQVGYKYLGGDLQLTLFKSEDEPLESLGEVGLRLHPAGNGLTGFYIASRIGYFSDDGITAAGELGFTLLMSYLTSNIGGGVLYFDRDVLPFFNISLGVSF